VGVATRTDRPIGSPTSGFARRERERTSPAPEPILSADDVRTNRTTPLAQSRIVGVAAGATAVGEHAIALEDVAGAGLLVSDVRATLLLVDEARDRVIKRLFGVSRNQSWPVTLIVLALVAHAAHEKSDQMLRGPDGRTRFDVALGVATLSELLIAIPGRSSQDTPSVGTLVTLAVVGALVRPGLSRTVHGIRTSSHRTRHSLTSVRPPAGHVRCGQSTLRRKPRRPPLASVADKPPGGTRSGGPTEDS
jgi:hypothetical protein